MYNQTVIDRFFSYTIGEPNSGCLLWTGGVDKKGYGRFRARVTLQRLAHRFSWEFAHGPIPNDMGVLHKCDTPACVRADHLFLGTNLDNNNDKVSKNRQAKGMRNSNAKFTEAEVLAMRASTKNYVELAKEYGTDRSHMRKICKRIYWRAVS